MNIATEEVTLYNIQLTAEESKQLWDTLTNMDRSSLNDRQDALIMSLYKSLETILREKGDWR